MLEVKTRREKEKKTGAKAATDDRSFFVGQCLMSKKELLEKDCPN